jgi:hypothetical protein
LFTLIEPVLPPLRVEEMPHSNVNQAAADGPILFFQFSVMSQATLILPALLAKELLKVLWFKLITPTE